MADKDWWEKFHFQEQKKKNVVRKTLLALDPQEKHLLERQNLSDHNQDLITLMISPFFSFFGGWLSDCVHIVN